MKVAVVGAGLLGQLLAYTLQKKSYDVTVITASDKQAHGSASYAAAGMLTPMVELEHSDYFINRLGTNGMQRWKTILPALSKEVFFKFNGSIVTAHPDDNAELAKFARHVEARITNESLNNGSKAHSNSGSNSGSSYYCQSLTTDSMRQLEPELSLNQGWYFSGDGHIESRSLIAALNSELDNAQVKWCTSTIIKKIESGCAFSDSDFYQFDMIFDCRGYGAKDMFPSLRGVRGELLYLDAVDVRLQHPIRLLTPRYPIYIVPLPNQQYIVGASQIEAEDHSPISVRSCLELLTAVYSIHPGFAEARLVKSVVGLRPALPDNLPQIKLADRVIAINGLYRHGFLVAPTIIDEVINLFESGVKAMTYPELLSGECDDN